MQQNVYFIFYQVSNINDASTCTVAINVVGGSDEPHCTSAM